MNRLTIFCRDACNQLVGLRVHLQEDLDNPLSPEEGQSMLRKQLMRMTFPHSNTNLLHVLLWLL